MQAQVMQAIVIHQALDLRVEQRDVEALGAGEVRVAIKRGGICGSDLHYYRHGGFGTIRLQQPMVLGHEVSGVITEIAPDVANLQIGDKIAVSPSRACGQCEYCQKGLQNHCLDMMFYGSAMRFPHVQGAFQQSLNVLATQCHVIDEAVSFEEAAFAEPFAVTLHAITRAGSLANKTVMVTGCGPIGALAIASARFHGAREIIATDVSDYTLGLAAKMGADHAINVANNAARLDPFKANKGRIDVLIEASGNEQALRTGLECLKPRGTLVQLGLGGDISIPQNMIVAKEIEIKGSFRFHEEFALAVDLINKRRVNLLPLLTEIVPLHEAKRAFELAGNRAKAMKVQIAF
jgi:L-idonate 5-dehydrogenase